MENEREIVKTLKLSDPIKHGEELITQLEFVKPKARHMRKLPAQPTVGDVLDLAGKLAGQPPSVIDELSWADALAVAEVIGNF